MIAVGKYDTVMCYADFAIVAKGCLDRRRQNCESLPSGRATTRFRVSEGSLKSVNAYGSTVNELIDQFSKLPGIGKKSAERIAYHFLRCSREEAFALADAIKQVKLRIHACPNCFNLTEDKLCQICADPRRDPRILCVVEQPRELLAL